jgi:capping protein alpha
MDASERIQAASSFLLQSPPGEINDVLNGLSPSLYCLNAFVTHPTRIDVRNIISDDDLLQEGVLPALKEYNLAQFITADVPGTGHQVTNSHSRPWGSHITVSEFQSIVSEAARFPSSDPEGEERFLDPRSNMSFRFDHLSLVRSVLFQVYLTGT